MMINTNAAGVPTSSIQSATEGKLASFKLQVDTLEKLKQHLLASSSDSDSEMKSSGDEDSSDDGSKNEINEIDSTLNDMR